MSATKPKPVKNKRDIFEATEQPYGTEDFRKNMVGQWISYQQIEPPSLYEPTVLESNAHSSTQKSRSTPLSKSQQHNEMYNKHQRMKKRKHDQNNVSEFVDFDAQPPLGIDCVDEPFFEFDISNERKIRSSGNQNNNITSYDHKNRTLNDPLPSNTQNRKQKYDIGIGRDEYDATKSHRHHHQSQHYPINEGPSSKRQKSSNQHFGMDDLTEFDDFQFDFDDGKGEERQQQRKEKKSTNIRLHDKNVDKHYPHDAFTDFDLLADAFDDDGQNDRQPTSQFIYKRFKERSYAELMGTTPTWQKADNNARKNDAATGVHKNADDGFLFKHPTPIGDAKPNAVGISGLHDERHSHRHHHHRRRDHREPHGKNQLVDEEYVISHEIEKFIPKPSDVNNELYVLKTGHNRTATATSHPNTFYIKCNNLVIKHD